MTVWCRAFFVVSLVSFAALVAGTTSESFSQTGVRPTPLASANPWGALRVFGEPGDLALENAEVSAVVRRRDGGLVDFLRRRATLPTVDPLGTTTNIDGLWELVPTLVMRDGSATPLSAEIRTEPGALVTTSTLVRDRYRVSVNTRYELDPGKPRLRIAVSFVAEPALPPDVDLGLIVRWGNVSYFVEGDPSPLLSYAGSVRWAGRRGAGGDLVLRAVEPEKFVARFHSRPGFQAALQALIERSAAPLREARAVYELAYEPLPLPPQLEPARAHLEIDVEDERGRPLAAKATLLHSADPKRAVFPVDGGLSGADRFAWTGNGRIVTEPPPGRYAVLVSSGPERDLVRRTLVLEAGKPQRFRATLRRVVPTPGWVAADLHLHQAPSVDADVSLEARVISVAAEGLEFAVPTDHYVVTDLYPTIRELVRSGALARPLLTVPGSEVSTLWTRFGHFNVFPLPLDATIEYRDTTPSRLFAAARRASPNGVLQVNHPRYDARLGYFAHFELDPKTAQPRKPGFDPNFDTIEVYNGDDAGDLSKVEKVLQDFVHLLGRGRRYVATGSSDSHKLAFLDAGVPRTLIAHGGRAPDDDTDAQAPVSAVLAGLKAGNAIVTSGPFIDAHIDGVGPGRTVYAAGPRSELRVRVLAPPWVSVSRVRVLQGADARVVHDLPVPPSAAVVRFDRALALSHTEPTFVLVTVKGDAPLPNTGRGEIRPFAFTNPIWITP